MYAPFSASNHGRFKSLSLFHISSVGHPCWRHTLANPSGTSAGWRYEYAPTTATGTVKETGSQLHAGIDRAAGKECESVFEGSGSTFRTGIHETPAEETRTTEDILREKSGRVHGRVFIKLHTVKRVHVVNTLHTVTRPFRVCYTSSIYVRVCNSVSYMYGTCTCTIGKQKKVPASAQAPT